MKELLSLEEEVVNKNSGAPFSLSYVEARYNGLVLCKTIQTNVWKWYMLKNLFSFNLFYTEIGLIGTVQLSWIIYAVFRLSLNINTCILLYNPQMLQ